MKKALIFVDHDLLIRHFIISGAFRDLEEEFEVTYVFNLDTTSDKRWIHAQIEELRLRNIKTTAITRKRMGSWHRLHAITVLHNQRGTRNYHGKMERLRETDGIARTRFHALLGHPLLFPLARRYYLGKQRPLLDLETLIDRCEPDIIIHPSILAGFYINELPLIAKKKKVPFVVLMNSWDNPSQKAVATSLPDKLVVWGKQTRDHAIEFMRMAPNDVLIFGASQFQIYREPVRDSRSEILAQFRVPEGKRLILYAGVSKSIDETRHLAILEEAIASGALPNCHVIYRPHPWRGRLIAGERGFFEMGFQHVTMDPHMERYYKTVTEKDVGALELADYSVTHRLFSIVDGVVSTLSTILLESLLNAKPAIAFIPPGDMIGKYGQSNAICLRLAHFQGLWESPGLVACKADSDLPKDIASMLKLSEDKSLCELMRKHAIENYADMNSPTYGERLLKLAHELTG